MQRTSPLTVPIMERTRIHSVTTQSVRSLTVRSEPQVPRSSRAQRSDSPFPLLPPPPSPEPPAPLFAATSRLSRRSRYDLGGGMNNSPGRCVAPPSLAPAHPGHITASQRRRAQGSSSPIKYLAGRPRPPPPLIHLLLRAAARPAVLLNSQTLREEVTRL